MRYHERNSAVIRSPKLVWDTLVRGKYTFIYDQMPITYNNLSMKKRFNLFRSGANLLYRKLNAWSMPLHMQFEFTNYCNLNCPICPTGTKSLKRKTQFMSPGLFEQVIDQAGPYLLTASLWGWGEPNLHPNLRQMLQIARKHQFATFLSTNGQNLNDPKVIDSIIEAPPTYLIVALDGLTDDTNSVFRKGAKLKNALEGVSKLAEIKKQRNGELPILHMRFIVMKHNQHEVQYLKEFAKSHHFDFLTIRTLSIIDTKMPDETHRQMIPDNDVFRAYDYNAEQRLEKTDFYCLQPFWFPTLFADGTVVSCEQDYNAKLPMGKIDADHNFKDIWYSQNAQNDRRRVRDKPATLSYCRNCPFRDRDETDCSVQAYVLNDKISFGKVI